MWRCRGGGYGESGGIGRGIGRGLGCGGLGRSIDGGLGGGLVVVVVGAGGRVFFWDWLGEFGSRRDDM